MTMNELNEKTSTLRHSYGIRMKSAVLGMVCC